MANKELRGASRRDFLRGATALGAALGWGPAKLLDFIERGGGTAAASCATKGIQKLVVLCGTQGAHGYNHFLFPHPDSFGPSKAVTGRYLLADGSSTLAYPFMKNSATGGTPNAAVMSKSSVNFNGMSQDQRFQRMFGVDNQAFGGWTAMDSGSQTLDTMAYGSKNIPSNTKMTPDQKYMITSPYTPWIKKYGINKAITAIDGGGINPFHINGSHSPYVNFDKKWTMMAAAATIQTSLPTILPVIICGDLEANEGGSGALGFYNPNNSLPGAPAPATVNTAFSMVDLFNSNATLAGGTLSNPKNAVLYEAYTKGLFGSSKSINVPTFGRGYGAGKLAANLVGLNLSEKLKPTDTDRLRYGYTANAPANVAEYRDRLIVAAKALQLGLTAQVCISFMADDPHSSFTQGGQGGVNASDAGGLFSGFLNAFMDDLMSVPDPHCPGVTLGDNTVIAFTGDTPRTAILDSNWNDPTVGGQNRTWIMGNGLLRTGFFGGDRAKRAGEGTATNDHTAAGPGEGGLFDPKTGDFIPFDTTRGTSAITGNVNGDNGAMRKKCGEIGMAAVLYAITRGDVRRVNDFYSGPDFPAIQVPVII